MFNIDIHIFGNINYFKIIGNNSTKIFPANLYQKGWYANRFTIAGANGTIDLSVPLQGGRNQKITYKDIKIVSQHSWQKQHLKSLSSCYGNAPFFDYYYPIIKSIYFKKTTYLLDLNLEIIYKILSLMKLNNQIEISNETMNPEYISFTKQYTKLNSNLIDCNIKYPQVFEDRLGFIPNLSIIDLLMCLGPEAISIISNSSTL